MKTPSESCKISIVVTLSREEYVELVRENLLNLELNELEVELIVMIDNRLVTFPTEELTDKYPIIHIHQTQKSGQITKNIPQIRGRIANVRNISREYVGETDFVFSFEDDTEIPKDALVKLLGDWVDAETLNQSHGDVGYQVGLISGIQVGRHGRRILGAWKADNYQFPTEVRSVGMDEINRLTEVDATGFYCYLTPTDLYKKATYGWMEPLGPDGWYGFWLRMGDYKNYIDPSIICGHRVGGKTLVPDNDVIKLRLYQQRDRWINEPIK